MDWGKFALLPILSGKYYVGFSGGSDSVALLLILLKHLPTEKLIAVHFQHGLREEAEAEAIWCEAFCRQHGIMFIRRNLDVPKHRTSGESIEEAARRLRLEAWQHLVTAEDVVVLAHHKDDVLENFFLRLSRGAACSGLTSLREKTVLMGRTFWRPLLSFTKNELTAFLRDEGIEEWCEDASNQDCQIRRNAVRLQLLPLFREIFGNDEGVKVSIEMLRKEAVFLEKTAKEIADHMEDVTPLRQLDEALLPRVMRYWLLRKAGKDVTFNKKMIERISELTHRIPTEPVMVHLEDGQLILRFHYDEMRVVKTYEPLTTYQWDWQKNPELFLNEISAVLRAEVVEHLDAFDIAAPGSAFFCSENFPERLTIRRREAGDAFTPLGREKSVKLKKMMVERDIPREKRDSIPVLDSELGILWVPGVRRSDVLPIDRRKPTVIIHYEEQMG